MPRVCPETSPREGGGSVVQPVSDRCISVALDLGIGAAGAADRLGHLDLAVALGRCCPRPVGDNASASPTLRDAHRAIPIYTSDPVVRGLPLQQPLPFRPPDRQAWRPLSCVAVGWPCICFCNILRRSWSRHSPGFIVGPLVPWRRSPCRLSFDCCQPRRARNQRPSGLRLDSPLRRGPPCGADARKPRRSTTRELVVSGPPASPLLLA